MYFVFHRFPHRRSEPQEIKILLSVNSGFVLKKFSNDMFSPSPANLAFLRLKMFGGNADRLELFYYIMNFTS